MVVVAVVVEVVTAVAEAAVADRSCVRGEGGGKPEKLRTKEIKLMSFLEGASAPRRIYQCVGDGGIGGGG